MEAESHSIIRYCMYRSRSLLALFHPTMEHCLPLLQSLSPDQMIILLRERRTRDFSMLPPRLSFRGHDIIPKHLDRLINLQSFREIIPSRGDLGDDVRICSEHQVPLRADCDECIATEPLEWLVPPLPAPWLKSQLEPWEGPGVGELVHKWN